LIRYSIRIAPDRKAIRPVPLDLESAEGQQLVLNTACRVMRTHADVLGYRPEDRDSTASALCEDGDYSASAVRLQCVCSSLRVRLQFAYSASIVRL